MVTSATYTLAMNDNLTELPIFTRTIDFLAWLGPLTNHFPRNHRHTITKRLLDATLDLQETLLDANNERGQIRLDRLKRADWHLSKIRFYMRLIHRWQWISQGQYEHASRMITEIGRLLGGWQRTTNKAVKETPTRPSPQRGR